MTENPVYQSFDTDADGTVSNVELEGGLAKLHAAHDADGNGALSTEEFGKRLGLFTRSMASGPSQCWTQTKMARLTPRKLCPPHR
jgi:hypothetical protein